MATIRNRLAQRIVVEVANGKTLGLLAGATATVTEKDLASPHLQSFLEKGSLSLIASQSTKGGDGEKGSPLKEEKKKTKKKSKKKDKS